MKNRKGFTLIELLIAATIIGTLAVFATIAYKESVARNHIAAAKAKTEQLARGVQRFRLEHPLLHFSDPNNLVMGNVTDSDLRCSITSPHVKTLITCDYVDNGGWTDEYVRFFVCEGKTGSCASAQMSNPLACMKGRNHPRLPIRFRGVNGYIYCVGATGDEEQFGSGITPGGETPGTPGTEQGVQ